MSDAINVRVPAQAAVVVSLYVSGTVGTPTSHGTDTTAGWIIPGDASGVTDLPPAAAPLNAQALISVIEIHAEAQTSAIVVGDSRTNGTGSTPGADRRWTDILARRLADENRQTRCVINQGIDGGRMLADGIGPAALSRFDRDVLATPGPGYVIVSIGNDVFVSSAPHADDNDFLLTMVPGEPATPAQMIAAYQHLADRANLAGVPAIAAAIPRTGDRACTLRKEKSPAPK